MSSAWTWGWAVLGVALYNLARTGHWSVWPLAAAAIAVIVAVDWRKGQLSVPGVVLRAVLLFGLVALVRVM